MVSIWVWCRALSNGHAVYNLKAQGVKGYSISWPPLLAPYWKAILVPTCFSLTTLVSTLMQEPWWSWGLPVGILSSFAILHSGLFGTYAPLKLTAIGFTELDQITAFVTTVVFLIIQYGRQFAISRRLMAKLKAGL